MFRSDHILRLTSVDEEARSFRGLNIEIGVEDNVRLIVGTIVLVAILGEGALTTTSGVEVVVG
jgi:hypothetical protein